MPLRNHYTTLVIDANFDNIHLKNKILYNDDLVDNILIKVLDFENFNNIIYSFKKNLIEFLKYSILIYF